MMPSKTQMTTILITVGLLWAVHNVGALDPVRKFLNFDQ